MKQVDQHIHRILVEADASNFGESSDELWNASAEAGKKLYNRGDFEESQVADLDVYILKKVKTFKPLAG